MHLLYFEGIKDLGESKGYDVSFFDSGDNIRKISNKNIQTTVDASKNADYVIVVVGDNSMRYKWKDKTAGENIFIRYFSNIISRVKK